MDMTQAKLNLEGKPVELFAPDGTRIEGVLQVLRANAFASSWTLDRAGDVVPEWEGETEVDWDSSKDATRLGQTVYVDANGQMWLERELTVVAA